MSQALIASILAGSASGLGALPILLFKVFPHCMRDGLLGFSSGVMIAASSIGLILPALEIGSLLEVSMGILTGGIILALMDIFIPHYHSFNSTEHIDAKALRRAVLMIAAIVLHNIPEGLAVGIGYASGRPETGLILAVAIGAQNAPEGLLVALPLKEKGIPPIKVVWYALLSGLVEPVAAIVGILMIEISKSLLPFSLAFAAGAMYYVVSAELIPESHGHGYEKVSTFGFLIGIIFIIVLDHSLS
jgi:ZIP family zinc transporter